MAVNKSNQSENKREDQMENEEDNPNFQEKGEKGGQTSNQDQVENPGMAEDEWRNENIG